MGLLAYLAVVQLSLAAPPRLEQAPSELTYGIELLGSKIGTVVHRKSADGKIESVVEIPSGPLKGSSRWSGKVDGDELKEFELKADIQAKVEATLKEGRIKGSAAGRTFDVPAVVKKPFFANFHVGLNGTVFESLKEASQATVTLFLVENMQAVPAEVKRMPGRSLTVDGKTVQVRAAQVKLGALTVDLFADEAGDLIAEDVPAQKLRFVRKGFEKLFEDPLEKYPELSQPTFEIEQIMKEPIKLSDGVTLYHSRLMPKGAAKSPTILIRTPYGRATQLLTAPFFVKRGYTVVVQDCRGREESEGEFDPFFHEGKDGAETIEWIAKQPWSDGNVGMIGGSYAGAVQWQAAVRQPKALKCIIPQVSPPGPFGNIPYEAGAFALYANVWWSNVVKDRTFNAAGVSTQPMATVKKFEALPLSRVENEVLGQQVDFYDQWLKRTKPEQFGDWNFTPLLRRVKIPALMISGWWDGDGIGTRLNWEETRRNGIEDQWLIYGPWPHAFNTVPQFKDVDYGPNATLELDSVYLRWFDAWLKGKEVGLEKLPRVQVFITGANEWRSLDDWPAKNAVKTRMYLGGDGPANDLTSMGRLLPKPKESDPDRYTYNPAAVKVPEAMTKADREPTTTVDLSDDPNGLIYRSEPMKAPMTITGPVDVDLYFSTSANDADFMAMLADESPDGTTRIIGIPGIIRAGHVVPSLRPNRVHRARIKVWDVGHQYKPGHRMALLIASNRFPMFARNMGTGEPIATATRMVSAHQTIYRDPKRPSSVSFYVLP